MENRELTLIKESKEIDLIAKTGIEAISRITENECNEISRLNDNLQECFNIQKKNANSSTTKERKTAEEKMEEITNKQFMLSQRKSCITKTAKVLYVGLALLPVAYLLLNVLPRNNIQNNAKQNNF